MLGAAGGREGSMPAVFLSLYTTQTVAAGCGTLMGALTRITSNLQLLWITSIGKASRAVLALKLVHDCQVYREWVDSTRGGYD